MVAANPNADVGVLIGSIESAVHAVASSAATAER
jgi:hypothetical protein